VKPLQFEGERYEKETTNEIALGKSIRQEELMADRDATHQTELEQLQKSAESMKNKLQDGFQKRLITKS
jgi:hypothetical protein